jgi:hypothetical protein
MKPLQTLSDDEFSSRVRQALVALPDAPRAWQAAATKLWPTATSAEALKTLAQGVLNRIAAVLTFDSWAMPALAHGMRSVSSPTRHLLYSSEGRDIDLRISPDSGVFTLTGQILGPDEAGTIEFSPVGNSSSSSPGAKYASSLDALGEFRIAGLSRGIYIMTLHMGKDQIVIPGVEVGERPK